MRLNKSGILRRAPEYVRDLTPQFMGLKTWLLRLTYMFQRGDDSRAEHMMEASLSTIPLPPYDYSTMAGHVTYEAFMAILETP